MTKMTYAEQLLHPKWQRKRLEILQAADFKCESCEAADKTLHVHHKRYIKGRMAWEYENTELQALCKDCHAKDHEVRDALARFLASKFGNASVEQFAYGFLAGFLAPFGDESASGNDIADAMESAPLYFVLGYMVVALGPSDIADALRKKRAEGRLEGEDGGMLDWILRQPL